MSSSCPLRTSAAAGWPGSTAGSGMCPMSKHFSNKAVFVTNRQIFEGGGRREAESNFFAFGYILVCRCTLMLGHPSTKFSECIILQYFVFRELDIASLFFRANAPLAQDKKKVARWRQCMKTPWWNFDGRKWGAKAQKKRYEFKKWFCSALAVLGHSSRRFIGKFFILGHGTFCQGQQRRREPAAGQCGQPTGHQQFR